MKRITYLRLMRQVSKAELARRAGLAAPDVSKIESGRFLPYNGQLTRLAKALDWPAERAAQLLDEVEAIALNEHAQRQLDVLRHYAEHLRSRGELPDELAGYLDKA